MSPKEKRPITDDLIEGVHYYFEGSYLVFTETYHLLRGYCCGNGCRHCPYTKKSD